MKMSKKNRDLLRKDPLAYRVKRIIMLYAGSSFTKKMTLGRLRQIREAMAMLTQPERKIALRKGWDRGFLYRGDDGKLHCI